MKKRARELGFPFEGICGKWNAITDVKGVEVGMCTVIQGEPEQVTPLNSSFARTGVTAILPRGKKRSAVFAGRHDLNGNGELTGCHWIDDSGFLHGPILITNTNSVGIVRDTTAKWMIQNEFFYPTVRDGKEIKRLGYFYPVVGETYDGILNNITGFNVKEEHVLEALNQAKSGLVPEGNVGGGTGMRCHMFKGGTGTASRVITEEETYTIGVLVQANHGTREKFEFSGIPLGKEIQGAEPVIHTYDINQGDGSIIVIIATDAPVLPWQLKKLCRRATIAIGRLGGGYENGSGDIFLAFSTANENAFCYTCSTVKLLSDERMNPLYKATTEAVEEAILNAMVAAEDMVGRDQNFVPAMPHEEVERILKKYGKYTPYDFKK